ncbi:MAG TPA: phospholipase D-like domain-containing protein, partial [Thermoanaerobaculia bacterium]|nr:phospholipase D-like domain-containing protein [Thermoanaerobaculia bacterium]
MVLLLLAAHLLGLASSLHALMTVRTAQGTIAWIVSLNTLPLVALPAYWAFGRSKLEGYVVRRRRRDQAADPDARRIADALREFAVDERSIPDGARAAQRLARLPFLRGNRVDLLIDGEATFDSLLAGVEAAERYLLVQFYVLRDDRIGGELRDRLIERARAGVRVRLLYDELGCAELPDAYLDSLSAAGVEVASFGSIRWRWNHLQINFRNHRKVMVADGAVGWVGGLNVGDEYLGRDPDLGPWRDTHLRLAG